MGQDNFAVLNDGLSAESVRRGVTAGGSPPNGGGSYVFGMHAVENVKGAAGLNCTQTGFSPTAKGGRIAGAMKRGPIGGTSGFAPFLFFAAEGSSVNDSAYLLGLSDEVASHIELRKGPIVGGLPDAAVTPSVAPNLLMRSIDTFKLNEWQHLRLDVIVQGTGDVILQVFRSDLALHAVSAPVWETVPGMEGPDAPTFAGFVDDTLGVRTGSAPLLSGRLGFAARFESANRVVYFDHIAVDRQL